MSKGFHVNNKGYNRPSRALSGSHIGGQVLFAGVEPEQIQHWLFVCFVDWLQVLFYLSSCKMIVWTHTGSGHGTFSLTHQWFNNCCFSITIIVIMSIGLLGLSHQKLMEVQNSYLFAVTIKSFWKRIRGTDLLKLSRKGFVCMLLFRDVLCRVGFTDSMIDNTV